MQFQLSLKPALPMAAALILAAGSVVSTSVSAEPRKYEIDSEHFSIGFMIGHIGYEQLLGMFLKGEGSFVYDEETTALTEGRVTIASNSVFTNHEERDDHVKGDDFLDVGDHESIVFEAGSLSSEDGKTGKLDGSLTMLGKTMPVVLDVTLNKAAKYPFGHEKYTLGISARTTIKRSEWGMDYGVDNNLVGDDVAIILEFEAIRQ